MADALKAIHGRIPAHTLQSLKQKCRIGMGRCQGSRCTARLLELLHRELHIPYEELRYSEDESMLFPIKAATGELF